MNTPLRNILVVRFSPDVARADVRRVLECCDIGPGPDPRCRWHDAHLLTMAAGGDLAPETPARLESIAGVERVLLVPREGLLARFAGPDSPTTVALGNGRRIGGGNLAVIAGPCSVESEAQVCEIAEALRDAGADALRGGAFKPRTSPYDFAGLGLEGLAHLEQARRRTGLPVVTEVLDPADLDAVAHVADVIQIGARSMSNFPLLFKVGSHPAGKPVLLKRGFGATLEEYLLAAEYVLLGRVAADAKEPGLILCERGIRTFETATRFTLDVAAIPLLQERTGLPVVADPSHAAGARRLVPALARASVAAGADGLLIEVHPQPARAWSDAGQALDPAAFRRMMVDLRAIESLLAHAGEPAASR